MKIVRYFLIGTIAASLDIILFTIFASYLKFPWAIVSVITFVMATFVNYFLSIKFVFKSQSKYKQHHEIISVFILSALALFFNQLFLYFLIERVKIDLFFSKCLATGALFILNYYGRKKIIFSS